MNRALLLVDDDENYLKSMARIFLYEGYKIFAATSGDEAIKILDQNKVQVIVSDQRMPGMSGVELLSRVKYLYPDVVRIVITGYADIELATKAVNKGAIFKFLVKPCSNDLLRSTVQQAFRYSDLQNKINENSSEFNDISEDEREECASGDGKKKGSLYRAKKKWGLG